MFAVYLYVLDTMADWEASYAIAELHSKRYFKPDAPDVAVKTVALSKDPIRTMGGVAVLPDCTIEDLKLDEKSVLLLPGANTWDDPIHGAIVQKASELLSCGGLVAALCGSTVALAHAGLLDDRPHTSNGAGFLEMFCPTYKGKAFYVDAPSVAAGNLITAGATGGLLWAKQIIEKLDVFKPETLDAWYAYFSTGETQSFFALLQSLAQY